MSAPASAARPRAATTWAWSIWMVWAWRAAGLFQRACSSGMAHACHSLGVMCADGRGLSRDERRAAALFTKACDGGDAEGCSNLGGMYALRRGVAKDPERALLFLEKGCAGGDQWACDRLQ